MKNLAPLLVVAMLALGALPAAGHHSVAGQFDLNRPVTLKGVITDVEWVNPHIYVHVDVGGEGGNVEKWRFESVPPAFMRKARMTPEMLKGDGGEVTIDAILARDGTRYLGYLRVIHYADGHSYQLGETD